MTIDKTLRTHFAHATQATEEKLDEVASGLAHKLVLLTENLQCSLMQSQTIEIQRLHHELAQSREDARRLLQQAQVASVQDVGATQTEVGALCARLEAEEQARTGNEGRTIVVLYALFKKIENSEKTI